MSERAVDVAGTGFTVLDRVYADQEAPFEALGGSCGNVLVSLAMLDHSVAPLLSLGEDDVGRRLVEEFVQAGADTSYISRRRDLASPVLTQQVDTASGQHWFSFICPETEARLPRYRAIEESDVDRAATLLSTCSVFYTDRLSESILRAMELASDAGALVYFEPSQIEDGELFQRAVALATILKCSVDRLDERVSEQLREDCIAIVTHGAAGLEIKQASKRLWCNSLPAPIVRDTCGSGDMVSVGLIDWLLKRRLDAISCSIDAIQTGVVAGQRLAAANCAYVGARGLFAGQGASVVRRILDDPSANVAYQIDLFDEE